MQIAAPSLFHSVMLQHSCTVMHSLPRIFSFEAHNGWREANVRGNSVACRSAARPKRRKEGGEYDEDGVITTK